MSLTRQTILVQTRKHKQMAVTLPAEHIYPFIIHRSVDEYLEKQSGDRTRYSKKHCVTHLLTGAVIAVFENYTNALGFVRKLKDKPIFLMPTIDLLNTHPDWDEVAGRVASLKLHYGCII